MSDSKLVEYNKRFKCGKETELCGKRNALFFFLRNALLNTLFRKCFTENVWCKYLMEMRLYRKKKTFKPREQQVQRPWYQKKATCPFEEHQGFQCDWHGLTRKSAEWGEVRDVAQGQVMQGSVVHGRTLVYLLNDIWNQGKVLSTEMNWLKFHKYHLGCLVNWRWEMAALGTQLELLLI